MSVSESSVVISTGELARVETLIRELVAGMSVRKRGEEPPKLTFSDVYEDLVVAITDWDKRNLQGWAVRTLDGKEFVPVFGQTRDESAGDIHEYIGFQPDEFTVEDGQRPNRSTVVSYLAPVSFDVGEQALYCRLRGIGLAPKAAEVTVALHRSYAHAGPVEFMDTVASMANAGRPGSAT